MVSDASIKQKQRGALLTALIVAVVVVVIFSLTLILSGQ